MLNRYLSIEKEVALVFMLPELAPRISAMLNHFLVELVGPRCSTLKVREPEKYHFNPKGLLHEIVSIILHFAPFPEVSLHARLDPPSSRVPSLLPPLSARLARVLCRAPCVLPFPCFPCLLAQPEACGCHTTGSLATR